MKTNIEWLTVIGKDNVGPVITDIDIGDLSGDGVPEIVVSCTKHERDSNFF